MSSSDFRFGDFRVPCNVDLLYRADQVVALEPRPLRVLRYLVEHHDRVVSKEELLDNVWPDVFTTEGVLKKAVSQVRRALGDDAASPRYIETYHGRGYRFVAAVAAAEAPADVGTPVGNLPARAAAFIGRRDELRDLAALGSAARALTLTGPGGIGKTALAIELAHEVADEHPGGVWLVELGELADSAFVVNAVGTVFGARDTADAAELGRLVGGLAAPRGLLVLDNCEHLVDEVARVVAALLKSCPTLRVLATSRVPLGVPGEAVWKVPPLDDVDAAALFASRARLAVPTFAISDRNADAVGALCARLEGNPLAIGLAAARLRALSVDDILARLDDRLDLLSSGDRVAPARQRTLRATIEWSYALLEDEERRLLAWLSVFAGPWTLASAEALAGDRGVDVVDVLTRLVDKSLVAADTRASETRYAMLDSIRRFARERLAISGEEPEAVASRREWALAFAERFDASHFTPLEVVWLDRLATEHASLRAAWQEAAESRDAEACAQFVGRLWLYWEARGHWAEGLPCVEVALESLPTLSDDAAAAALYGAGMHGCATGDLRAAAERLAAALERKRRVARPVEVGRAVRSLGTVFAMQGRFDEARAAMAEGEAIFRSHGDPVRLAWAKGGIAWTAMLQGDLDEAAEAYAEACALLERAGVRRLLANAVHNLADVHRHAGRAGEAEPLMRRALELAREADERRLVARSLQILASLAIERGDAAAALALLAEALPAFRLLGDQSDVALAVETAAAAHAGKDPERAIRLAAAAAAHRETFGADSGVWDRYGLDVPLVAARAAMGPEAASRVESAGRSTPLDEAVRLAVATGSEAAGGIGGGAMA